MAGSNKLEASKVLVYLFNFQDIQKFCRKIAVDPHTGAQQGIRHFAQKEQLEGSIYLEGECTCGRKPGLKDHNTHEYYSATK